jgi:GDP-L-fucose synthase
LSQFDLKSAKKIVITGGAGFLGKHVQRELERRGADPKSFYIPRSREEDLRDFSVARRVMEGADLVLHLAARVGGIGFNQRSPGALFYDNAAMGLNVVEASRLARVKKLVMVGTICAYPGETPVPFREEDLWNGYPEVTNAPYGIAKKSIAVMIEAYRRQYGLNGVFLLPVNLYGPEDNFDLEDSHVIPALIRKFIEARDKGAPHVTLWGDGSPTREFLYVDDAARGIVMATESYESSDPVNLGSAEEISIRDLAEVIRKKTGFQGEIKWDKSRPNGQARRKLDVTKAQERFGFRSQVGFDEGLERTIEWWLAARNRLS